MPIRAHRKLKGALVMIEPRRDREVPGEWLRAQTLSKVYWGRVLVQLFKLGNIPTLLPNRINRADLYVVLRHCIAMSLPVVEAVCAPLQAAMSPLDVDQYKQLLDPLDVPFQEYPLSQQCLLHQLLEKHILVFAAGPEDYG